MNYPKMTDAEIDQQLEVGKFPEIEIELVDGTIVSYGRRLLPLVKMAAGAYLVYLRVERKVYVFPWCRVEKITENLSE